MSERDRQAAFATRVVTVESLQAELRFARGVSRRQRSKVKALRSLLRFMERRLGAGDVDGVTWLVENWRDIIRGLEDKQIGADHDR